MIKHCFIVFPGKTGLGQRAYVLYATLNIIIPYAAHVTQYVKRETLGGTLQGLGAKLALKGMRSLLLPERVQK